jgi:hypothetical protein
MWAVAPKEKKISIPIERLSWCSDGLPSGRPGFEFQQEHDLSLLTASTPALGPMSLLSNGFEAPSPGVKRQGREADHSPASSA